MLADRIRRGERLGRNCRRPRFSEIWEKTGPGPSKQVRNPPVHIWSQGQSQVRVLLFGILARYTIPGRVIWRGKVAAIARDSMARRRKPCADSSVKTGSALPRVQ